MKLLVTFWGKKKTKPEAAFPPVMAVIFKGPKTTLGFNLI